MNSNLILTNLSSPLFLAFLLGVASILIKSDLKFPSALYTSLSIYLLLAIGLKGGVAISENDPSNLALPILATLILGLLIPVICFYILKETLSFSIPDSAALAAHYGSVSIVTFLASLDFVSHLGLKPENYLAALVAILEIPAILIALILAKLYKSDNGSFSEALKEVVTGKSVFLLLGGLIVGTITGAEGFIKVKPFFVDLFPGLLFLFLLEIGMICGSRIQDLRTAGFRLISFGILMPIFNALIAIYLANFADLSVAGATVFATMAASASYIAAPAAVRIALPEANPGYYMTASLVITFPFNLSLGIPLYFKLAEIIYGIL